MMKLNPKTNQRRERCEKKKQTNKYMMNYKKV